MSLTLTKTETRLTSQTVGKDERVSSMAQSGLSTTETRVTTSRLEVGDWKEDGGGNQGECKRGQSGPFISIVNPCLCVSGTL